MKYLGVTTDRSPGTPRRDGRDRPGHHNPGSWMFHCHVLEHQEGGMMAVKVA
jgi:hypothetical protein